MTRKCAVQATPTVPTPNKRFNVVSIMPTQPELWGLICIFGWYVGVLARPPGARTPSGLQ